MHVDEADTAPHQRTPLQEAKRLLVGCHWYRGQAAEQLEHLAPIPEVTAGQLADDEWMRQHTPGGELIGEGGASGAEMLHPDRRVDQDQRPFRPFVRRRRGTRSEGSVPPRRASRRALSRSINARSPSWIRAVRSLMPVRRCASARRSSSTLSVVRMISSRMHETYIN